MHYKCLALQTHLMKMYTRPRQLGWLYRRRCLSAGALFAML